MKHKALLVVMAFCLLLSFPFCKKSKERTPLVTTSVASAEVNVAHCSGVLYSPGDAELTEKGICWGLTVNIGTGNNKVICENGTQNFTADIIGLEPGTTYYARAYAINAYGTSYGKVISFTTLTIDLPSLLLYQSYSPTVNSLSVSLQVNQYKPFTFTTGICWSKTTLPTVLSNTLSVVERKYTDPVPFTGNYTQGLNNLDPSSTYYARAFCSSAFGVVYSNQINWTTATQLNPVSFSLKSVGHTSVSCTVNVSNIDPAEVKSVGVCWNDFPGPTLFDYKLEKSNTGTNNFNITGLQPNTTYYLRAYVVTATKTIFGPEEKSILTLKGTVTDINGNIYNTVEIGGVEWMTSNLRASSFNNGTPIPLVANYNQWVNNVNAQTPVYCYYGDNASNNVPYGKLYPRYVAQNPNIAPVGWRVATMDDWYALINTVGVQALCITNGNWDSPETINPYGFSLYAAGYWDSGYSYMGSKSRFWATPTSSSSNSIEFTSETSYTGIWYPNGNGQSIRCVKQ